MAFTTGIHPSFLIGVPHPYLFVGTPVDLVNLNLDPQSIPMHPDLAVEWFNELQNGQPFPLLQTKGNLVVENGQILATFWWLWYSHKIEGFTLQEIVEGRVTYRVVNSLPGDSPALQSLQNCRDWFLKTPVIIWKLPDVGQ